MSKANQKAKGKSTKKAASAKKRVPPAKKPQRRASAKERKGVNQRETFEDLTRDLPEDGPELNPSILKNIEQAEEQVRQAVRVVATTPELAESLADARSHPKLVDVKGEPWTLDYLCSLSQKDGVTNADWPQFCDSEARVSVKRGAAPSRKVPASQLEAWFRGDKTVIVPRQVNLEGEIVLQKDGASYRIIRSLRHYFESGPYEATIPKSKFALVKSADVPKSEKLAIVDRVTHLKTTVKEDPGEAARHQHKEIILGLMMTATLPEAENANEDDEDE